MSGVAPVTPSAGYDMISVNEAQHIVLDHCEALPSKTVPLKEALGCVAAEDVIAKDPLPPFPASIKDGYAVRSEDGIGEYPSEQAIHAGSSEQTQLQPGTVHYITTGAPVPEGADAVVQIEDTTFLGERGGKDYIKIEKSAVPGQDIRPIGSDIEVNAQIIGKGETIGAAEMGLLATIGQQQIPVIDAPLVAVMSTGDELLEFDAEHPLPFGRIRDANRPMLLAACQSLGMKTIDLGIADDSEEQIRQCIQHAIDAHAHIIICSGGVSMGDKDAVRPVLEKMGSIHFGKLKMKPGKPALFCTYGSPKVLFFGLPGNPVSSYVCFHLLVEPAIRKLRGWTSPLPRRLHVTLSSPVKLDPVRPEYARAGIRWTGDHFEAVMTGNQISSRLLSARSANVLLELPQREGVLETGTVVSALLIDDLRSMGLE